MLEGDPAGGLAMLEAAIKQERVRATAISFVVGADLALLQGKFAVSRGYLERLCPTTAG